MKYEIVFETGSVGDTTRDKIIVKGNSEDEVLEKFLDGEYEIENEYNNDDIKVIEILEIED